eukprot:jgi/Orpsp1_1/1188531/evm.model.d7180000065502.1
MELTNISENQKLIMNVDLKDNFPGVNEDNSCIIIGIEKEKIYYIKITSYILTNKYNNILVDNNKKDQNYNISDDNNEVKNSLYSCKNGICTEIKLPSDGFYLKSNNQKSNELILCENNNCIFMNTEINEGFYISGNKSKPLIQCILNENLEQEEESNILCFDRDYKQGWYLNADPNTNFEKPMIFCDIEKGCQVTSVEYPGWYINNGINSIYNTPKLSNSDVYPIIKCSTKYSCEIYPYQLGNECQKNGEIINPDGSNNSFKFCKSKQEMISIEKLNNEEYILINIENRNDIPGSTSGNNIIRVSKTEAVVLIDDEKLDNKRNYYIDEEMYSCTNKCEKVVQKGILLYDELTKNIFESNNCNNNSCQWKKYDKEGYVFIDDNDQLITNTENKSVAKLYKCKINNKNMICFNMKNENTGKFPNGYYYNNEILDSEQK